MSDQFHHRGECNLFLDRSTSATLLRRAVFRWLHFRPAAGKLPKRDWPGLSHATIEVHPGPYDA